VDPFFLPLPVVRQVPSDWDRDSIHQLQLYLDVALCLLRQLAERLQSAQGPEALEPELRCFLADNDILAQSALLSQLDTLVRTKQQTEAVRLLRERFGITWDQAFDLYDCWESWDRGQKLRCLQAAELRKLFAAFHAPVLK
jgi:hypothetical protein